MRNILVLDEDVLLLKRGQRPLVECQSKNRPRAMCEISECNIVIPRTGLRLGPRIYIYLQLKYDGITDQQVQFNDHRQLIS